MPDICCGAGLNLSVAFLYTTLLLCFPHFAKPGITRRLSCDAELIDAS